MNLLFAIKSLNVKGGGAERVLVHIANGLAKRGHHIKVFTFDSPGDAFYDLDRSIGRLDVCVGQPGKPTPRGMFLKSVPEVRRIVTAENPDLVIAFMHSMYVPLSIALFGTGIDLVASEHIDAAHYRCRPLQHAMVWLADRFALAKTVPSKPVREHHPESFRDRVYVMPNPVELAKFIDAVSRPPATPPVILSIGRLTEQKNHIELVRAFALLAGRFPEWKLRLVGEGDLRSVLESEVNTMGLSHRVTMPGIVRDVAAEYQAASIVALPSLYESFGLVAAEALASGRALVAFDNCVGIAEMVETEVNGLLVSSAGNRVKHLSQGLERLMSDVTLRERLSASGPDSIRKYALNDVLETWESFFLSLCKNRKSNG
jgi:GalNAc-alpha-(1->4)-GalNAc-alpha-(1->3)-diNAcBac-PP-undecaprenol alpha-1,4-N-acetyl-D-galactosaminyltransferase